ncbi:MAG: FecR domain-containing protein, partial [Ginsengibacter sp.]
NSDQPTLIADTKRAVQIEDISPGVNNAILTLDDGSTIILDSVNNGSLATQGNSNIVKTGNQISYMLGGSENISIEPVYNTISTANSNQYQLTLSDGTRVWLNAASSIRFPSSFIGKERKVEVSGEVYFEVAKSNEQKFKVAILNGNGSPGEIEVLGTHFNINAYNNEPDIKTTLLEGSLRVNSGKVNRILLPGQQALQDESGIQVKQNVNLEQVVAWKNGYFLFNNTDLKTLMRQVSRWYNVEVVFEGTTHPDGFSGKVGRDVPLSNLIKALELNDVKIQRVGRNLIVKP